MTGKEYVYRVYTSADTYIGVWPDVVSEFQYSQRLLTPGSTTTVRLARSAQRKLEVRDTLVTDTGETITAEDGDAIVATAETNNTVGIGTDVELNNNVDIYVHYGSFEDLVTEDGETITAEDGDTVLVSYGAPLGTRVFSGFIIAYEAVYAGDDYIDVTVASHGYELSQEVIRSGTTTTVNYSTAISTIVKTILDTNPGRMGYTVDTIDTTATTMNQTFQLNTKLEGIEAAHAQSDSGWYWYGSVADRKVYFKARAVTADHKFVFKKHIKAIRLRRSMEDLRNTVYFAGGYIGGGAYLFKKYVDATSVSTWRQGIHRIVDRRYTLDASAARYGNKVLSRYKDPIYTTAVTIAAEVYDIESIKLGQMVGFSNFDNFVDTLLLQIVELSYTATAVTLTLGELQDRQTDIISEVESDLQNEQFSILPTTPT